MFREHADSSEESTEHYEPTRPTDDLNTTESVTTVTPDSVTVVQTQPENITTYAPRPPKPTSTTQPPDPMTTEAFLPTTRPLVRSKLITSDRWYW